MFFRNRSGRWWIGLGLLALVVGAGGWAISHSPSVNTNTDTTVTGRAGYALLYDAFWRSDDGKNPTLITATLFPPSLVQALQQAGEKTVTEQQMYDLISTVSTKEVGVVVSIDSVTGSYADAEIKKSMAASIDGQAAEVVSWTPIISSSRVVNAPSGTASQVGVVRLQLAKAIPWATVQDIRIKVSGLGASQRSFVWSETILRQALP